MPSVRRRSILTGLALGVAITAGSVIALGSCGSSSKPAAVLTTPGSVQEGGNSIRTQGDVSGKKIPSTVFDSLDGTTKVALSSIGKPMVVNVWASWCAPCKREMPTFEAAHQRLGDQVTFIGLNSKDDQAAATSAATAAGVSYQLLYDPRAGFVKDMGVIAYPATLFVNAQGKVLELVPRALEGDELTSLIKKYFGV